VVGGAGRSRILSVNKSQYSEKRKIKKSCQAVSLPRSI
jgi:hypothetical protein